MSHFTPLKLILASLSLLLTLLLNTEGTKSLDSRRQPEELLFLGTFGTKSFYLGGQVSHMDHFEAAYACRVEGMRLARFDSQEEVSFVFGQVPFPTEAGWTDGLIREIPSSFAWTFGGDAVSGTLNYDIAPSQALLLDTKPWTSLNGVLVPASRYDLASFYCYTESL